MIRIHPVQAALLISLISLFLFIGFATTVNRVSESYEGEIRNVQRQENYASKRLDLMRSQLRKERSRADSLEVIVTAERREEVLWTARALYSETKRPSEMWYVGWVIRNRVESSFRGKNTYREVILDPKQFSAFNRGYPLRDYYLRLEPKHAVVKPRWHDALAVAKRVIEADEQLRPFPKTTLHFYSEQSMDGHPHWKYSFNEVPVASVQDRRFRFYSNRNVSSTATATAR